MDKRIFLGLKKHSHAERSQILRKFIVPALRKELGKNLIAIAADGSFARREDSAYSDLELMIFVKDSKNLPFGFSKIYDGLLIEGLFITEQEYHDMIHEPNKHWYIAGSDKLRAITNRIFVDRLEKYRVKDRVRKFTQMMRQSICEVQESFGKLFNAIDQRNSENLFIVLSEAVNAVLKLMAYSNQKPYSSSRKIITESRALKKKPRGLDDFLSVVVEGKYLEWNLLERVAKNLFSGIEEYMKEIFADKLYDSDLSTILRKEGNTNRR